MPLDAVPLEFESASSLDPRRVSRDLGIEADDVEADVESDDVEADVEADDVEADADADDVEADDRCNSNSSNKRPTSSFTANAPQTLFKRQRRISALQSTPLVRPDRPHRMNNETKERASAKAVGCVSPSLADK